MKKTSDYISFEEAKAALNFNSIGEDLVLLEDISKIPFFDVPRVQGCNVSMICISGSIDTGIDLERYTVVAPSFSVIMRGQITQFFGVSDDFKGLIIASNHSAGSSLQRILPLFMHIKDNPVTPLTEEELQTLKEYYYMLKKTILTEYEYCGEIADLLLQAMSYNVIEIFKKHKEANSKAKTSQELLFDKFLKIVKAHYKENRELSFYADKLSLTTQHVSSVIKKVTGTSPNHWIDGYVILYAKALLKSTKMTIQQISDELNFANQSFFGKYFKRHVGLSPKEYREK